MSWKNLIGETVDFYWNSHKKLFSVRHKNRVVGHVPFGTLRNVKFVVSEKGRQRVLKSGKKNVHAYMRGVLSFHIGDGWSPDPSENFGVAKVRYNPYHHPKFYKIGHTGDCVSVESHPVVTFWTNGEDKHILLR